MIITGWTGGYFAGAPIAGYILQAYGGKDPDQWSYRPAIFYAGSMALGAAGFVLMLRLSLSLKLFKKLFIRFIEGLYDICRDMRYLPTDVVE